VEFSRLERRAAPLLAAALLAASPGAAQTLSAAAGSAAASAPAAVAAGAAALSFRVQPLTAPAAILAPALSARSAVLSAAAPSAELNAAIAATGWNPYAPAAEPAAILGDPVLTQALAARAERVWTMAGTPAAARRAFQNAIDAADFTGARAVLDGAAPASGRDPELSAAADRLRRALDLPDHPDVARVRQAALDAHDLRAKGRHGEAMAAVDEAQREFSLSPATLTDQRWTLRTPLIRLSAELRRRAAWVYDHPTDAFALRVPLSADGVRAWLARRRAADPASVAGDYAGRKISRQKWSDCELQAIWNLPALRALHQGRSY
jgi:hypothetical protein